MTQFLQNGDNISLTQLLDNSNEIIVVAKCFSGTYDINDFEIDVSAILLSKKSKVRSDADYIFFKQPHCIDNAVFLKDHMFKIILPNISKDIDRIIFILTLFDESGELHLGYLDKIIVKIFNFSTKQELISYTIDELNSDTAIMLAQLQHETDEWVFNALGRGQVKGLESLARNYGIKLKSVNFDPPSLQPVAEILPEVTVEEKTQVTEQVFVPVITEPVIEQPKPIAVVEIIDNKEFQALQSKYLPIMEKYKQQAISQKFPIDTLLLFDEMAYVLRESYALLNIVSDSIKIRQRKGYSTVNIDLSSYNANDIDTIRLFCNDLFNYAFIASIYFIKEKKMLALSLHRLPGKE